MPGLLSSDILEKQFGPTELEILSQDKFRRVIITKTAGSGQVLELSRVTFHPEGIAAFPEIHQEVTAGRSMGKAFSSGNIRFTRDVHAVYHESQDPELAELFGVPGESTVVEVTVLAGPDQVPYADILETYSPSVKWPEPGKRP